MLTGYRFPRSLFYLIHGAWVRRKLRKFFLTKRPGEWFSIKDLADVCRIPLSGKLTNRVASLCFQLAEMQKALLLRMTVRVYKVGDGNVFMDFKDIMHVPNECFDPPQSITFNQTTVLYSRGPALLAM